MTHLMGAFLVPIIRLVIEILNIYWWIVIISVLYRLTEPVYRPFRRFLPNFGGLDISPLIVLLIIWLVEQELIALAGQFL